MIRFLAFLLAFTCGLANAQNAVLGAFSPSGKTITFTANTSGNIPSPVQATTPAGQYTQYVITNIGTVPAFISYAGSAADATTACVIPTGTSQTVIPILASSQFVMTTFANSWFCGITSSSTAVIYITPGVGN